MKLLDLFCGAGGCSVGYHRAGFDEIVGVDHKPMRDYPYEFIQMDAIEFAILHGHEFDVIHASPPCQAFSAMQHITKNVDEHQDLVNPTRIALNLTGKPWVIENVAGAPLDGKLMLCGTMFGLRIIRHRFFEFGNISIPFSLMPPCNHSDVYDPWHGPSNADEFRAAMGIDWMRDVGGGRRRGTLSQAIPPAYTEYIGREMLKAIT